MALKYEDRDGDMITLSSQDDLIDLLQYSSAETINITVSESTALPQLNVKANSTSSRNTAGNVLVSSSVMNQSREPPVRGVHGTPSQSIAASRMLPIPRVERFPNIADNQRGGDTLPSIIRWKKAEMLGQGAFGVVYLGLNIDNGELMAVKQMATEEVSKRELSSLDNEINLLRNLRHPNIVRYIGTELTSSALSIFLEYVPGGSLKALIDKFGALEESVAKSYTRQLLLGLEYLHRNGIAHRDIKGANCLVGNDGVIKLADFGNSKHWRPVTNGATVAGASFSTQTGDIKGTPAWMAPEVIKDQSSAISWRKADIWSLGCTTLEMTTGRPPWSQFNNSVTILYHLACQETVPEYPSHPSTELLTFLNLCFQRDPQFRPDVTSLLLHPFVAAPSTWGHVRPTTMSSLLNHHGSNDFEYNSVQQSRGSLALQSQQQSRRNASMVPSGVIPVDDNMAASRQVYHPQTARAPSSSENTVLLNRDRVPVTSRIESSNHAYEHIAAPPSPYPPVSARGRSNLIAISASSAVNNSHSGSQMLQTSASFVYYDADPENTHERNEVPSTMLEHGSSSALYLAGGGDSTSLLIADGNDRPDTQSNNNLSVLDDSLNSPMPLLIDEDDNNSISHQHHLAHLSRDIESSMQLTPSPVPMISTPSLAIPAARTTNVSGASSSSRQPRASANKQSRASGRKSMFTATQNIGEGLSISTNAENSSFTAAMGKNNGKGSATKPSTRTVANSKASLNASSNTVPVLEMKNLNKRGNAAAAPHVGSPVPASALRRLSPPGKGVSLASERFVPPTASPPQDLAALVPSSSVGPIAGVQFQDASSRVFYDSDDCSATSWQPPSHRSSGQAHHLHHTDTDNESSLLYADDEMGSVDGVGDDAGSLVLMPSSITTAASSVVNTSRYNGALHGGVLLTARDSPSSATLASVAMTNPSRILLHPIDPSSLPSSQHQQQHLQRTSAAPNSVSQKTNVTSSTPVTTHRPISGSTSSSLSHVQTYNTMRPISGRSTSGTNLSLFPSGSFDYSVTHDPRDKDDGSIQSHHGLDLAPALEVEEEDSLYISLDHHAHTSTSQQLPKWSATHGSGNDNHNRSLDDDVQEELDMSYQDVDQSLNDINQNMLQHSLLLESMDKVVEFSSSSAYPTPVQVHSKSHLTKGGPVLQAVSSEGNTPILKSGSELEVVSISATPAPPSNVAAASGTLSLVQPNGLALNSSLALPSPSLRTGKGASRSGVKSGTTTSAQTQQQGNNGAFTAASASSITNKRSGTGRGRNVSTNNKKEAAIAADAGETRCQSVDLLEMSCDSLEPLQISGVNLQQQKPTTAAVSHSSAAANNVRHSASLARKGSTSETAHPAGGLQRNRSLSSMPTTESDNTKRDKAQNSMGMIVDDEDGSGNNTEAARRAISTADTYTPSVPSMAAALRDQEPDELEGHSGAITRLRAPKRAPHLLFSASMDGTVRLWSSLSAEQQDDGEAMHGSYCRAIFSADAFGQPTTSGNNTTNERRVSLGGKKAQLPSTLGDNAEDTVDNDESSLTGGSITTGNAQASAQFASTMGNSNNSASKGAIKITDIWTEDSAETLWSVCSDGCVRLWSISAASEGRPLRLLRGHEDGITCIAGLDPSSYGGGGTTSGSGGMSNTTTLAATGSMDRTIRLWDARARKQQVFLFRGHGDTVLSLAWSEEGRALISGSKDKMIKIWDTRAGRLRATAEKHFGSVHSLRSVQDTHHYSYYQQPPSTAGNLDVGSLPTVSHGFPQHSRGVSAGTLLGTSLHITNNMTASIAAAIYDPQALAFVSAGRDAMLNCWNASGDCISSVSAHRGYITCLSNSLLHHSLPGSSSSAGQQLLVSAGADSLLKVWDVKRAKCLAEISSLSTTSAPGHNSTITSTLHHHSASGSSAGHVNKITWLTPSAFVTASSGGFVRLYEKAVYPMTSLDESTSAATGAGGTTAEWRGFDLSYGGAGSSASGSASSCTDLVAVDGHNVACASKNGRILRWRLH